MTIQDVARAAGVSVSTVSRILNGKPDVAEATRARVQQVIERVGYLPHTSAQRLAGGKSRTIALLYPLINPTTNHPLNLLDLDFMLGTATAAGEGGYSFNLVTLPADEASLVGLYQSAQVDGVILMMVRLDDWRVEALQRHHLPFVMIGRCQDNAGLDLVDLDFENSVRMAFDYLVGLGHERIGFLNYPREMRETRFGPAVRAHAGFECALSQHGLEAHYRETDFTVERVYEATRQLLVEEPRLTGIVTLHEVTAIGVIKALHAAGYCVPADFSVVGTSNEKSAQLIDPALTTVDFPSFEMGYRAAQMMMRKLEQPSADAQQVVFAPNLVVRESTAPCRSG